MKIDERHRAQTTELKWTTRDLVDFDILEVEGLKANNLDNALCPVIEIRFSYGYSEIC